MVKVHKHSFTAYQEVKLSVSQRESLILKVIREVDKPLRDYDILKLVYPNSENINMVQPRITELHQKGILIEDKPGRSPFGNRPVRTSVIAPPEQQQSLKL